ncbi:MAG: acyltransferase [Bacteroidia bacterium]|nr:acyltransferase [Bacteroidia bacterium]MCZ2248453.1 acyltransferase [Bacteroidia bacterium]
MPYLNQNNQRITELDGLRGMAIFATVIYHYTNNLINADASNYHLLLKSLTQFFYTCLDMFFILSGFLLGGILLRYKNSPNYFKAFYARRFFRIVPLYLFLLVSVLIICLFNIGRGTTWWFNPEIPYWAYFTFAQNIFMGIKNTLGNHWLIPTWSLGVEEQFYLIVSVLIFFTSRKYLVFILLLGMICSPVFRYYYVTSGSTAEAYPLSFSAFLHCRLDSLFGGILLAVIHQNAKAFNWVKQHHQILYLLVVIHIGITFLFSIGKWHIQIYWVYSWFGFIYMLILLLVLAHPNNVFARLSRIPFFVNLGLYSYSIYLFHELILGLFFFLIPKKLPQINSLLDLTMVVFCTVLTYFFARFVYLNFEKKFMAMGHSIKY